MRALFCIALLVLSAPAAAESITLGSKSPYSVGQKTKVEKTSSAEMTITANGQKVVVKEKAVERKEVEVLAIGTDALAKAKITYTEDSKVSSQNGKQKTDKGLTGKTFTVTAGKPLQVTGGSEADADLLRKKEKRFGESDRMRQVIAGKTFTKDKPVDIDVSALGDQFGDPDTKLEKVTLTYRGKAGKLAKFGIRMLAKVTKGPLVISFDLLGTVLVDPATSDAVEMTLAGNLKGDGAMPVTGTMSMTARNK